MKFRHIADFGKAHGIRGEVTLYFFSTDPSWFAEVSHIYTDTELSSKKEILKKRLHKGNWVVKVESILTRNDSEAVRSKPIYLEESFFADISDDQYFLSEIKGFEVYLGEDNLKGVVEGFNETKAHDIILVKDKSGANFEIPWVEDFIKNIDFENSKIILNCPEELFQKIT